MLATLIAFIGVSAVVICTPGPDTALTVRNALTGGRRCGISTAAGVAVGQVVWAVAASLGVASLVHASQPAFVALKIAGTVYLVYLGVQSLRAAWLQRPHADRHAGRPAFGLTPARSLRQGIVNDLANPKMAVFFMSLLPQFAPAGEGRVATFLLMGLLFCLLTFAWLACYSIAVSQARRLLERPLIRRALDTLTGFVFIGFGLRLAAEQR